jgi:hypothetical protein
MWKYSAEDALPGENITDMIMMERKILRRHIDRERGAGY